MQDLAKLGQLDGQKVTKEERRESGFVVSSEDDEDEDEEDEENIDGINPRQSLEEFHRTGQTGDGKKPIRKGISSKPKQTSTLYDKLINVLTSYLDFDCFY